MERTINKMIVIIVNNSESKILKKGEKETNIEKKTDGDIKLMYKKW